MESLQVEAAIVVKFNLINLSASLASLVRIFKWYLVLSLDTALIWIRATLAT